MLREKNENNQHQGNYHEHKTDAFYWHNWPVFQTRNLCDSKYIPEINKVSLDRKYASFSLALTVK